MEDLGIKIGNEIIIGVPKAISGIGAGLQYLPTTELLKIGFKYIERPTLTDTQKLGEAYYNNETDKIHFNVVEKSIETIENEIKIASESNKQNLISKAIEKQIISDAQTVSDDEEALELIDVYPFWEDVEVVEDLHKYKRIVEGELRLYEVIESKGHATQPNWTPETQPSIFRRVGFEGEVLVWVQPLMAEDAYDLDEITKHVNEEWQSRRSANTSEPGTTGSGWLQISNLPAPWYNLGNEGYPLDWTTTHNGNEYINTMDNNFYEPGVYGWNLVE